MDKVCRTVSCLWVSGVRPARYLHTVIRHQIYGCYSGRWEWIGPLILPIDMKDFVQVTSLPRCALFSVIIHACLWGTLEGRDHSCPIGCECWTRCEISRFKYSFSQMSKGCVGDHKMVTTLKTIICIAWELVLKYGKWSTLSICIILGICSWGKCYTMRLGFVEDLYVICKTIN